MNLITTKCQYILSTITNGEKLTKKLVKALKTIWIELALYPYWSTEGICYMFDCSASHYERAGKHNISINIIKIILKYAQQSKSLFNKDLLCSALFYFCFPIVIQQNWLQLLYQLVTIVTNCKEIQFKFFHGYDIKYFCN